MEIYVRLRQLHPRGVVSSLSNTLELAAIPYPGTLLEYEEGWGMEPVVPTSERGLHLEITTGGIKVSGYGPQFTEEEVESLVSLGWTVR